ncbi:MAG: hypothetical protein WC413_04020 [Candidatus Nanoarchaeia archaeon]
MGLVKTERQIINSVDLKYKIIMNCYDLEEGSILDLGLFSFNLNGSKINFELPLDEDLAAFVGKNIKLSGYYDSLICKLSNKKVLSKLFGCIHHLEDSYNLEIVDFCPDCYKGLKNLEIENIHFDLSNFRQTNILGLVYVN